MEKRIKLLCTAFLLMLVSCVLVPSVTIAQGGRSIGWDQGAQGTIQAVGFGVPPNNVTSSSQGRLLARRAAIVDAYRNLQEMIQDVQINSETTMQNLVATNDVVSTKVSGIIRGARIVEEVEKADGTYQVVVSINMYGPNSLGEIAYNATKPSEIQQFPVPSTDYKGDQLAGNITINGTGYTGVIVDARGLGLEPTFSPVILDENGRSIYGSMYINADYAISQGMVDYTSTSDAREGQSRAGVKAIVVKAIRVTGNNCNVVISKSDADRILAANESTDFLRKCAVVFER
ncbi:LPP20 family lipoprotein [Pelosinus sp. UFO1]|uniref:LPP20 family lipoprotein n=1 Tax=Pelosinus sp. UFO1 TaxID=484770 RepID=UPI0004D1F075|nr:LPP20 family lipoprotein [Pelosinus sp. UFO1]AIF54234.1 Lipoprotein LPP20-like [Pelosinus sp. UFO1]